MKLIDEKIKALGLTKGEYCKKYGFKFKDFAAKVHTLEAKLEWANNFLKPLGLEVEILLKERHLIKGVDVSDFKAGDRLYYDEELRTICLYSGEPFLQIGKEGTVEEAMKKRPKPPYDIDSLL